MSLSIQNQKLEIQLNTYLEVVEPKDKNLLDIADNTKEIVVSVFNPDPVSGYTYDDILRIINYGTHIRLTEVYRSPLGEITIERFLFNVKPSSILKLLFPNTFK